MKLKRLPEDFRVVELSNFRPTAGPFALYRLTKTGLGTPEAVAAIVRRWQLPPGVISFGGLKDRHAVTEQFLTIRGGPARPFEQEHLRLEYLGQADRPFEPSDIAGNRFDLTLRDLAAEDRPQLAANLQQLASDGVPNYFDDQRFGSLGVSGEFIARAWCAGDWERTLWLALAEANRHDSPRTVQQKQLLNDQWGNWRAIADQLGRPQSHTDEQLAQVVRHLVLRPQDFRGAITRIDPQQRGLYLSSFQSFLWNRLLAALLETQLGDDRLTRLEIGPERLPFYRTLDGAARGKLFDVELPLPSARLHLTEGPLADLVHRSLAESGIELRQIRVKYPRDSFFAKGERRAISVPKSLTFDWQPDDLHPGREKLVLHFDLSRGSYATILVKRLTEL